MFGVHLANHEGAKPSVLGLGDLRMRTSWLFITTPQIPVLKLRLTDVVTRKLIFNAVEESAKTELVAA